MSDLFKPETESSAIISECGTYRYRLDRAWGTEKPAVFVMLNPSTADASKDDPTIRRCMDFARQWHCGGLVVVNLFAFRATKPADLFKAANPRGPKNLHYIFEATKWSQFVVCAWGAHGSFMDQDKSVMACIRRAGDAHLCALGETKSGQPRHPLYLPKTSTMKPYGDTNG